jgi:SAM-dependent methyltransferase
MNYHGMEMLDDPRLSSLEKFYIKVFGIPISGLRIRLRRILPKIQGDFKTIADLGCGRGIFSIELAKKYPDSKVVGLDIDEKQMEINRSIAEKNGLTNLEFRVGDIAEMGLENQFDLIVSVDNLEHIEDDLGAVKVFYKALKPGGKLVCHVPAYNRIWFFRKYQQNFDVEGHVRPGYKEEQLKNLLEKGGLKVESVEMTYGYLETVTNNISYLITGASMKNKHVYALAFPFLNITASLGQNQDPKGRGAGVLAVATKPA